MGRAISSRRNKDSPVLTDENKQTKIFDKSTLGLNRDNTKPRSDSLDSDLDIYHEEITLSDIKDYGDCKYTSDVEEDNAYINATNKLKLKVKIFHSDEVRIFTNDGSSVVVLLNRIVRELDKHYGSTPKLYYKDDEGE